VEKSRRTKTKPERGDIIRLMRDNIASLEPTNGFEEAKKVDENGIEYWEAHEIMSLFEYKRWENFNKVIFKARESCLNSGQDVISHFREIRKMVPLGSGAERKIVEFRLSRYACYLIAQNASPSKQVIATAQTYFAIQTRKQELSQELKEGEKRIFIRDEVKKHNKKLFGTAKTVGVKNFGLFNDAGYRGLYGSSLFYVEKSKGIKRGELLDRAGSSELAANLFRITQTDEKLKRDNIKDEHGASSAHNMVGGKVRETIKAIGGVTPEKLLPERHIKELLRDLKKIGAVKHQTLEEGVYNNNSKESFSIHIPGGTSKKELINLSNLLKNNLGNVKIKLIIDSGDSKKELMLPYCVNVNERLKSKIKEILFGEE